MSETLKEKTAKGMFWGGMNNGIQQLIGLVYGIILARLVAKSDFGVMAMINILCVCILCGILTSLIADLAQRDQK